MSTCLIVFLVLLAISVPLMGVFAAVGIYGVRKYLATAKTAEAKNTLGAIARAAAAAYERESMAGGAATHRLCASAIAVPHAVPKGGRYMPSSSPGSDFHTGDATAGWTCLKFEMEQPMYYQYSYVTGAGSGKSGASANGFEASARGDLDGNGVTSLFARAGDVRGGHVVVSTELYIENEFE
jgi:type IV pilus assembly protein PilA